MLVFDLQMLAAVAITLLTIGLAYMDIPFIGPAVRLIGVFVLPGWLLTNVLFGNRKGPSQETRFILVFGLGAALVALELVMLLLIGIAISRESIALAGAVTSLLLMGVLVVRLRTDRRGLRLPVLNAMSLSIVAVLVLYAFVPSHQPIVKESYTEFYIAPSSSETPDDQTAERDLVITSHEEKDHIYTVLCGDSSGSQRLLAKFSLAPESSFVIQLLVPPAQLSSASKMRLSLYRNGDDTPYRWVELIGGRCDLLSTHGGP
jgi:uncharacterized membrane protein